MLNWWRLGMIEVFDFVVDGERWRGVWFCEHYGCVVSLLCRCGNLDEALRLVVKMPYDPDAHIIGSLLAACRAHHEIDWTCREPMKLFNYVAISNAYAAAGSWNEVSKVRDPVT